MIECPGNPRPGDGEHMAPLHVWYRRHDGTWRCVKCRCERPDLEQPQECLDDRP